MKSDCCCCSANSQNEALMKYEFERREFLRKALLTGGAVALLPLLAEEEASADLFKPSAEDQIKLGRQAAADTLKKYPEVTDSRAKSFRAVGERLVNAMGSTKGPWEYSFRVVKSEEVNAFALPGGPMFIYTGLIDRIKSADELAGVTAHETQHVRLEHWAKKVASDQKRSLGLGILLGLTKAGQTAQSVTSLLNNFYSLKYSRGEEDAADANGLEVMYKAKYDPEGLIDLFNTLQKASGGKSGGPEFLSTHPLTENRIKKSKERIKKLKK